MMHFRLQHIARLPLAAALIFWGSLSATPPASAQSSARSNSQSVAGKPLAEQLEICSSCHGEGGNATAPNVPSIAGQQPLFMTSQLILFREGLRQSELMTPFVQGLKDEEILKLSDTFAKLPLKPPTTSPPDEARMKRGAELIAPLRCNNCHLPSLLGREQIPRITSQREDYLAMTMRQYRDNQRVGSDTSMTAALYGVADADIDALAHFLARQK